MKENKAQLEAMLAFVIDKLAEEKCPDDLIPGEVSAVDERCPIKGKCGGTYADDCQVCWRAALLLAVKGEKR
jgi:hypothetical protein